ncbi:MAG TPA: hypothetical protein PK691_03725 [Thermomicrobiales bacterium]|nr:hypothetical protein [Thermomicrobiales bacterium]
MWRWLLATSLVLVSLSVFLSPVSTSWAIANTGSYVDANVDFAVTWDPEQFALASVAGGGILLSNKSGVLFIGPDRHETAEKCVAARIRIDLVDAPLLFAYHYDPGIAPEPQTVTVSLATLYAWGDGVPHIGWFGCIPIRSGGFVVLRLQARTHTWTAAVTTFTPILEKIRDTSRDPASTPSST